MSSTPTAPVGIAQLEAEETVQGRSLTQRALSRLSRDRLTLVALFGLIFLTTMAFLAPTFENALGVSYTKTNITGKFAPICIPALNIGGECDPKHILGTDDLGRDVFVRLLYAGQVSLSIGFFAAILSLIIGVSLGVITGYYGGVIDDVINWVITTLNSVPTLFLLLIISAVILRNPDLSRSIFGGPFALIIILGLLGWTGTTRLVRGETLSLREREYILSARALGASPLRIMFVHIVPNVFSIVIIVLASDIGGLILAEAALSFLGIGVKVPTPSWGNMLTDAQTFFTMGVHLVILPGLLIFITVLCLFVIGDGLRDAFDPTTTD